MSFLFADTSVNTQYIDHKNEIPDEDKKRKLESSSTVYVGNLSFFTKEEQIMELFSRAGDVRKIIMGIDKEYRKPCGFCFVEFDFPLSIAIKYLLTGTMIDLPR